MRMCMGGCFYIPASSANFLLPLYPVPRFPSIACSQVVGFQSFSVYIFPLLPASKSNTAAILLVITTLLTLGAWLWIDFKISSVPLTAGSRKSFKLFEATA